MDWLDVVKMVGMGAKTAAMGGFGRTAQGAFIGAGIGAIHGAFSNNSSMIGGGIKGGLLGAGIMRYGVPAGQDAMMIYRMGRNPLLGMNRMASIGLGGIAGMERMSMGIRKDFGRARMFANNGLARIRGMYR